jgi:[ribosomal protein S5]-alanine N-acetyltransferase
VARPRPLALRRAVEVGRRVFLRRPAGRDQNEYLTLRRRSAAFLKRWEPAAPRGKTAAEGFAEWLRTSRGDRHAKLLICRVEDGAILGAINFNEIVRGPAQSAFLGYWIGAPHARQGYMTEALQLALRHGFGTLGLHRVEANILPGNRVSIALARRAGFRREGYSPGYLKIAGRWEDHERWALVSKAWRPRA